MNTKKIFIAWLLASVLILSAVNLKLAVTHSSSDFFDSLTTLNLSSITSNAFASGMHCVARGNYFGDPCFICCYGDCYCYPASSACAECCSYSGGYAYCFTMCCSG